MKRIILLTILSCLISNVKCQENLTKEINGKIILSDGKPGIGWNVFIYGVNSTGVVSNIDGEFQLTVPNEEFYIKASFLKSTIYQKVEKQQSSITINVTKDKLKRAKKTNMDSVKFNEEKYSNLLVLQEKLEKNRNDYLKAKQNNTLADFKKYLNTHSGTPYIDTIQQLYNNLHTKIQTEFTQIKKHNKIDDYESFKRKYPNTLFADSSMYFIRQIKQATEEFTKLSEDFNFNDTIKLLQLLNAGTDINAKNSYGGTFLIMSSQEGHFNMVKLLLDKGANVNIKTDKGNTALYHASRNGETKIVRLLLDNGAKVDCLEIGTNVTPLFAAAQYGYFDIVKMLAEAGANVNTTTNTERTTLMQAAQSGYTEIGEFLISKGCKINTFDNKGWNALLLAVQQGHLNFIKMLINKNTDVNLSNHLGVTPIFMACQYCHTEIVKQLIFAKANVNITTRTGATPLIVASQQENCYEIVSMLLKAGADANISMTWKGNTYTALELAESRGNIKIVQLLKKHGAIQ